MLKTYIVDPPTLEKHSQTFLKISIFDPSGPHSPIFHSPMGKRTDGGRDVKALARHPQGKKIIIKKTFNLTRSFPG